MTCRAPSSSTTCSGTPTGAVLAYDNEGRLSGWQNAPSAPTTTDSFLYDGEGNRVEQQTTTNGSIITSTVYVAGGLEEITSSGATTTLTKYFGANGLPTAERVGTNGPVSYLATDGQGTVSETLDGSGNVTSAQLYTPYGSVRYSSGSSPTSLGYTGQRADATTGLHYYHARYYDPAAGQFASADTVDDGLNRYGYVAGNPTTNTDPTGHMLIGDTNGGGDELFYKRYLDKRASKGIVHGKFLGPDAVAGDPESQDAPPEVKKLATDVAIAQDNVGGSGAYNERRGHVIQTVGRVSIVVYKRQDDGSYKAVQTEYLPIVGSEGGPHAEELNIKKAAEWLRGFVAQHTDRGDYINYRFDVNVMIGFRPCRTCNTQESFDGWKNQIQDAVSHYGSYGGFRLRMWYLDQDTTGPRYSDGTPMRSAYHLYDHGDSGWQIFQWPRIQSPDGGVDDE